MHHSLVTKSARSAMQEARHAPERQPSLAFLRSFNAEFFDDLETTLQRVPEAPDLTVFGDQACKNYRFCADDLRRWLALHPKGVVFPITIAASNEPGTTPAPMRLLLLVPARCEALLPATRALAYQRTRDMWGSYASISQSENAAFIVGLYAHADGAWEYGPVVGWLAAVDGYHDAAVHGLPVVPELVEHRMAAQDLGFPEALMAMMSDYMFDEIGFMLLSDRPEGSPSAKAEI